MFTGKLPPQVRTLRKNIKGINQKVPVTGGKSVGYIYLDNAASTPALIPVLNEFNDYLEWYSGVHRGTGYKSLISSNIYNQCHNIIGNFVGADPERDAVVVVKNTTEAINKLSYRLQLQPADIVLTTDMEHHSNDLPWRARANVQYAGINEEGELDIDAVRGLLRQSYPRVKLLALCGASNVTGHVNDVHLLAQMAHEYGCKILVDGAQMIPHRRLNMKPHSEPDHIDYIAFSGHKIYAPFGSGVLIGPRETFSGTSPEYQGGGTVKLVMKHKIFWADPPDNEEAGSPNVAGTYALARTLEYLRKLGFEEITEYEQRLTQYAWQKLQALRDVKIYGSQNRIGVISFNLKGISHALVGAVLCFDAGIGIRTGCFCAQNYVRRLLGQEANSDHITLYQEKRMDRIPGMVRISLAGYNTREEVDYLIDWLQKITLNRYEFKRRYRFYPDQGGYLPADLPAQKFINKICRRYLT